MIQITKSLPAMFSVNRRIKDIIYPKSFLKLFLT